MKLSWKADTPAKTHVKFQLRWADSKEGLADAVWKGPDGPGTFYEKSPQPISGVERPYKWLQYKAVMVSLNGCRSPRLEKVRVDFLPVNGEPKGPQYKDTVQK